MEWHWIRASEEVGGGDVLAMRCDAVGYLVLYW